MRCPVCRAVADYLRSRTLRAPKRQRDPSRCLPWCHIPRSAHRIARAWPAIRRPYATLRLRPDERDGGFGCAAELRDAISTTLLPLQASVRGSQSSSERRRGGDILGVVLARHPCGAHRFEITFDPPIPSGTLRRVPTRRTVGIPTQSLERGAASANHEARCILAARLSTHVRPTTVLMLPALLVASARRWPGSPRGLCRQRTRTVAAAGRCARPSAEETSCRRA